MDSRSFRGHGWFPSILSASFQAENLIEKNEEYLLVITLGSGEDEIYYYTRIMQPDGCHEEEVLDFAQYFHNTALSEDASDLATYIEPTPYANNNDLSHVNINSNLSQINYGTFDGQQVNNEQVALTDISTNYISLTLTYLLSRDNNGKDTVFIVIPRNKIRRFPAVHVTETGNGQSTGIVQKPGSPVSAHTGNSP